MDQPQAAPQPQAEADAQQHLETIRAQFLNGISWFYWIGGLSLINIAMGHFLERKFIFGLGFTEVLDFLAFRNGDHVSAPWLAASIAVSLAFIALGYLGRKGKRVFILAGLGFYVLDAALMAYGQDWLAVLFHAFAGWSIFKGFQALSQILSAGTAAVQPAGTQ